MELQQLRYVVALAEEASFSRAAARLGVAQPSLSQQVKKLEVRFGRPLFDRLPGRVVPTQAGQGLVEHARLVLAQVADVERRLGDREDEFAGPVTIGAIPTIAPYVLPSLLSALGKRHPGIEPRVVEDVTDRLVEMLERGELDVAVLSTAHSTGSIHVDVLTEEPLLLMLPRGHRLARGRTAAWGDLAGERFLVLHEMHCLSGQVTRVCHRRGVRGAVAMRGAQLSTLAAMVSAGLGVSIVPEMMCRAERQRERVYLPFAGDVPTRPVSAAWSLLRYRTQASRAVVELLREEVGREGPTCDGRAPKTSGGGSTGRSSGRSPGRSSGRSGGRRRGRVD